jgi:O-antigen ligase
MSVLSLRRRWLPRSFSFAVAACLSGLAIALLPQFQLALAAVAVIVIAIVVAIFAEPVFGLALALFVGPFQPLERITLDLPIDSGQVVLAIALLSYFTRALAQRRPFTIGRPSAVRIALAIFIGVGFVSFFAARSFVDWAIECLKWVQVFVLCAIVANERDQRNRWILIGAVLLSAAFQAIYGIIQSDIRGFGPTEFRVLNSETSFRAYGTFEQPNPFGGYMGFTWPFAAGIALYFWRRAYGVFRIPSCNTHDAIRMCLLAVTCTLIAALCLTALTRSGSRGALFGAAVAASAMVLVMLRHPVRWVAVIGLVAFVLFAFDQTDVIPVSIRNTITNFVEDYSSLDVRDAHVTPITFSVIERLAHWQAAIRMMTANPWLGVGFGNYAAAYDQYRLLNWVNALGHAHNMYLNIFAETGIVGFLAYLALWAVVIVRTIAVARGWRSGVGGQESGVGDWQLVDIGKSSIIHRLSSAFLVPDALPACIAVGLLGVWAHLTVHHLFDNLYVANMFMLIGVYLGMLEG